jgi:hypothetical protein|tara:strand:- start:2398 stop:3726 length:1329 start_codon:yes stop_codon:yes gene_type:complete
MDSEDFTEIKLFKAGKFNGKEYTNEHLKSMVAFYNDHQNIKADITFDHMPDKDKRDKKHPSFKNFPFSLGKISKLVFDGEWVKGCYSNVFEPIKKALKDKLYTTHSIECYLDVKSQVTKKSYAAVLSAVSILPAGTMPALAEVFEPYMYSLDTFNLDGFDFGKKEVCNFRNEVYQKMIDKEAYEKMMKKYDDMGMGVKAFEAYEDMPDEKKDVYVRGLEEKYKRLKAYKNELDEEDNNIYKKEIYNMSTEEKKPDVGFSNDEIKAIADNNAELTKQLHSLMEAQKQTNSLQATMLEDLTAKAKDSKVEKVLHSLSSGDTPKLEVNQLEKAKALLLNADDDKKVKFAFGDKEVEKTQFELAVDFMNTLPEQKQVHVSDSIVKKDGDFEVSDAELMQADRSSQQSVDSVIANKKFMAKNKTIDFSTATEDELQEAMISDGLLAN